MKRNGRHSPLRVREKERKSSIATRVKSSSGIHHHNPVTNPVHRIEQLNVPPSLAARQSLPLRAFRVRNVIPKIMLKRFGDRALALRSWPRRTITGVRQYGAA